MKDRFNTIWGAVFTSLFVLIMLPLPCFYNEKYVSSIAGIPSYIMGWLIIALITFALILIWVRQCWNRPEYCEFDEEVK